MRILGSIVEAFVLAVLHTRQHFLFGCSIARQLIGDQYTRFVSSSTLIGHTAQRAARQAIVQPLSQWAQPA